LVLEFRLINLIFCQGYLMDISNACDLMAISTLQ
jgi:hypothetical protein